MAICKTCKYGEILKGIFFTNYWCNLKNTNYLSNMNSCNHYVSNVNTCEECSNFNAESGNCSRRGGKVNKNDGACNKFNQ